jgi:hypothetical protein
VAGVGLVGHRTKQVAVVAAVCLVMALALPTASLGPAEADATYSRTSYFTPLRGTIINDGKPVLQWADVVMHKPTRLPKVLYGGKPYWNAVVVAMFGLQYYNRFLDGGDARDWARARRAADWLVRRQTEDGGWNYRMPFSFPRDFVMFKLPWLAAQAQGNALSLLVRVWRRSGDPRYERAMRRALMPLTRPVGDRGVRRLVRGHVVYEGFPTVRPSVCLEDFQLALLGLYDAAAYSPRAQRLLDQGLRGLSWALPYYTDDRDRPLYDLMHVSSPLAERYEPTAHPLNAALLRTLGQVSGDKRLRRYATRWRATRP